MLVVIIVYESVYRQAQATLPTLVVNKSCMYILFIRFKRLWLIAFIWCFHDLIGFSRGNCICAGQGNTIVSHFVVQRVDLIAAIASVPCGPHRSLIYACEWGYWVCWVCGWANKTRLLPYAGCGLHFSWLRCLCPVLLPLHHAITFNLFTSHP